MAGIGIKLNNLLNKRGFLSTVGAYSCSAVVYTGPVLLGICLLTIVRILSARAGAVRGEQDTIVVIITYAMLASLCLNNIFNTVTTRYVSDMIYLDEQDRVLPSLFGNLAIQLTLGGVLFGIFCVLSRVGLVRGFLCFILFSELVVVWMLIGYISITRDYLRIVAVFAVGVAVTALTGVLLVLLRLSIVTTMLLSVYAGYGAMIIGYGIILRRYFPVPKKRCGMFDFLRWFDRYPQLALYGIFSSIGMFSHMVIVWLSPYGQQITGLFYGAPMYDIPALFAFLTALVTTVCFSTSTEVNCYPRFREFFGLLNSNGTLHEINTAEKELLTVLGRELMYLVVKQFVAMILAITMGASILNSLGFAGLTATGLGTFRLLCVGYGIYASANSIVILILFFADYRDALICSVIFAVSSTCVSYFVVNRLGNVSLFGVGFIAGAALMYAAAAMLLWNYIRRLQYNVVARQPLLAATREGFFSKAASALDRNAK